MSLAPLRLLIPILFLLVLYLSQRYWARSARRTIDAVRHPAWRTGLRYLWTATAILLLVAVVERFAAFHNAGWPTPAIARFSSQFVALWFTWSIVGFLAISLVRGIAWIWRTGKETVHESSPATSELSNPPADAGRRHFLRTATYAAGALPLAGALYGFAIERFEFEVYRVD